MQAVQHQPDMNRFIVEAEGHLARLEYELAPDAIRFTHTVVPEALGGRGIGKVLVLEGLAFAKQNQLRVIPECSFVQGFIARHPEWQSLLEPA